MDKKRKFYKKLTIVLSAIFLVWMTIVAVDYLRVSSFKKPIFSIPYMTADDGGSGTYQGLGYSFELEGNFMPEDDYPGVTHYEYYIFGRLIKRDNTNR